MSLRTARIIAWIIILVGVALNDWILAFAGLVIWIQIKPVL